MLPFEDDAEDSETGATSMRRRENTERTWVRRIGEAVMDQQGGVQDWIMLTLLQLIKRRVGALLR